MATVIHMDLSVLDPPHPERWGEKRIRAHMRRIERLGAKCQATGDMMGWLGLFSDWADCQDELVRRGLEPDLTAPDPAACVGLVRQAMEGGEGCET